MTFRRVLGDDERLVHQQVDDLLDREDGLIVLFDGDRMVSYSAGFGVSPCQLELLIVEIERSLRSVIGGKATATRRRKENREKSGQGNSRGVGTPLRQHLGGYGSGHHRSVADRRSESVRPGDSADGIVAGLLVVYFAWREKLRRRALAERDGHRTAA